MTHAQKPYLVFQRNGRVLLNRRGCQFSRLLAVEECRSVDSDCIDRVPTYRTRLLATHSIRIFPLHFPSHASPCALRFRTHYNLVTMVIGVAMITVVTLITMVTVLLWELLLPWLPCLSVLLWLLCLPWFMVYGYHGYCHCYGYLGCHSYP